ncbi:MAG: phosphotransferase [Mariprofundaceae bacterium]
MAIEAAREMARAAFVQRHVADANIRPLAGDASFRRYFRICSGDRSLVLMDAPPPKEDVRPFLAVRDWLAGAGVRVPALIAADVAAGFLLLEDFGDRTWATHLAAGGEPAPLFADAWRQLRLIQDAADVPALPVFDTARMHAECDLYLDWYLPHVAGHAPDAEERARFHARLAPLIARLAALPQVPVHLDWHSRNLMLPQDGGELGVLDFQDAVVGPVTYDAASLLYDCYQDYPESARVAWSEALFSMLPQRIRGAFDGPEGWHRMVRLTALQRHLKAIGIFARLAHRDGKRRFLGEIPLTIRHLRDGLAFLGEDAPREPLLWMDAPALADGSAVG